MAEGTWTQGGRALPLTLKRQAQEYTTANIWANRPQRPVGPFPYDSEEVTFENQADSVTLAGTLTLPRGTGRHPAVVLISGSGPQDRDQSLMEHKPFLVLADYLTRRGIAVLRYDDRGTAKSTGRFGPPPPKILPGTPARRCLPAGTRGSTRRRSGWWVTARAA